MSFPYSYSILGLVPGLIVTVVVAMSVLYTSLIVWYVVVSAQPPRPKPALISILGNSVSVTPNFETFVMSVKCSTLDGDGSGTLLQLCSCSTIPSSR